MHRVLITSPSLEMEKNVSGISALVAPLVRGYPSVFTHLSVGTEDKKKGWMNKFSALFYSVFRLFWFRVGCLKGPVFHLNTAVDLMSLSRDLVLAFIAKLLFFQLVVHFHGGLWMTSKSCPAYGIWLVRLICGLARKVIVLGEEEVRVLSSRFFVNSKVESLSNFVSPEMFLCNQEVIRKNNQLLFVGRLVESKCVDRLSEIFCNVLRSIPDARLVICGDGPLKEHLLADMAQFPPEAWDYLGVVSGNSKKDIFYASDVYILPSVSGEGMPVAMLEAVVSGCIPVVTNLGAIPSVIRNGIDGKICPPGDIDYFSRDLISVLNSNEKEYFRQHMAEISGRFSVDQYFNKLILIYK